ncbi:uncharacterized protein EI97DRAFT_422985 [Westerdykella ornata]|uniref:Uncharacterized protein n=1 Tax=Westerdykella ornata TaxID=318751 RepID=A0A6A6JBV1_WESOR|nr:uncharacterized protein EI97DRAFT_422985 [Westerdykella ornata]KAF2274090.1 hypothetical protein EI97DRAFT_422985 [Westerdykella ornata]
MRLPPYFFLSFFISSLPLTIAHPEPRPDPDPDPLPQFTNNAPFSGAIYIVNTDGQPITYTSGVDQNLCPAQAPVSCGTINQPSWCCPNSYTCAVPASSNGLIGCCPSGSSCAGPLNQASVSTVTVYAYPQPQRPTITALVVQEPQQPYQQGFCSTLTAKGPGLPTTRQGDCGVILVVSEGVVSWRLLSYMGLSIVLGLQVALGRMFQWF